MKVVLKFCINADIIDCPNDIIKNLGKYQLDFFDWLFDENINHSYWMYEDGKKEGCCYRSDAFVEWLNSFILAERDEKAIVLEVEKNVYPKDAPCLNF